MSKRTFVSLAFCLAGIFALYGQEENQNNYGVDEANTKFSLQSGVLGGETLQLLCILRHLKMCVNI